MQRSSDQRRTTFGFWGWSTENTEFFTFYQGALESIAQNGMPIPL
jgi:hypothetical protein